MKFIRNLQQRPTASGLKEDAQAAFLEFIGTFLFLLLGLGGIQAAARSNQWSQQAVSEGPAAVGSVASIDQLMYIAASMGLSLLISAWLFYRVTGGLFNPAVTTALLLVGAIGLPRWAMCCAAQLLGAIAASGVLVALLPGPLVVNTTPGTDVNTAQAVFIEMFLTSALVLAVLMLAAEKHRSTAFAPLGIGLTLFAGHLFGVIFTGASMNPARSFGPAVVTVFESSHWVYWLGPMLGSFLAVFFYSFLKHIHYWRLNPGQDEDDITKSPPGPMETLGVSSRGRHSTSTTHERASTEANGIMTEPKLHGHNAV